MICCSVVLKDSCHVCHQPTVVHIDRDTVSERGWGCTTCATAKEYSLTCQMSTNQKKKTQCGKSFKRYYAAEPSQDKADSMYCNEHYLSYIANLPFTVVTQYEFIPQRIKDERVEYANDQLQSHRQGELSREFLEAHPKRANQMLRDGAITKEDVKKSKYVWRSDVKGVTKKVDAESLIRSN